MSIPLPSLEAPTCRLAVEQSHLDHPQSRHSKVIKSHCFNYKIETITPVVDVKEENDENIGAIEDEKYYEARIQACSLIHPAFIEAFVKRGSLVLLSVQTHIDTDNVIALDTRGNLFLHLTKESYQQLGLDGKPSIYKDKKRGPAKYVVELDLTKTYFRPGKPNYERVRECLLNNHTQFYNVVFKWIPEDEKISPVSVTRYFQSLGYECREMSTKLSEHHKTEITRCPVVNSRDLDGNNAADYQQFWEWLGAVSCVDCIRNSEDTSDSADFLSMYVCPEPSTKVKCIKLESAAGLIHTQQISSLLSELREKAKSCGWCALTVHGFQDAPVTFNSKEHGYLTDGDNMYTFVIFSDGTYWLYTGLGSYDDVH